MYDDAYTRNENEELAVRTVSTTGDTGTDANDVFTRDENGKLCLRVTGGGGSGDSHNKGYYATQAALEEAYPTAEAGDWAIVGATDTVWVWDEDSSAWVDTDTKGEVTPDMVIIKSATMPTPSTTPVGAVYQYTGATGATYTHDYIYENVSKTTYNGTITTQGGWLTFDNTNYSLGDFFGGLGIANYQDIEVFMLFCMGDISDPDSDWAFTVADGDGNVLGMPLLKKAEIEASGFTFVSSDLPVYQGAVSLTGTTTNVWEVIETGNQVLQCADMPFPMPDIVGKVVQYVGTTGKYTNGYFYKCVVVPSEDPDISDTYSWEQTNVQPAPSGLPDQTGQSGKFLTTDGTDASWGTVESLPSQTGQSGKFLTTDGTDASWSDKPLVNKATGGNENIYIGTMSSGQSADYNNATMVGMSAAARDNCVTVGNFAESWGWGVSIGAQSRANVNGGYCVSLGAYARTSGIHAIQLGSTGSITTNSDANTFKVANANGNFEIMSADGTIPEARLADTTNAQQGDVLTLDANGDATWAAPSGGGVSSISVTLPAASWSGGSQTVTATGVTASNTVIIGAAPASQAEYTTCGVICTSQGVDSLTFTATSTPTNDLSVTVLILA